MPDYQESVTAGQTHTWTDRQTPDKVIPMCRYASQVTQKYRGEMIHYPHNVIFGVAVVTPTDHPKSVRNRCVFEVFHGVLCVVTLLFGFFCRYRGFCHRTESDLFLFVLCYRTHNWIHITIHFKILILAFNFLIILM